VRSVAGGESGALVHEQPDCVCAGVYAAPVAPAEGERVKAELSEDLWALAARLLAHFGSDGSLRVESGAWMLGGWVFTPIASVRDPSGEPREQAGPRVSRNEPPGRA
jgi:hypothetical protein